MLVDELPRRPEDAEPLLRQHRELLAVQPGQRNGKRRTRRSPQHLAGVGLDDEDPAVRVGVREHVLLPGSPRRRYRRDPPLQQPVVCPVADDDAQRGTGQVGDAEPAGRPAGRR